LDEKLGWRNGGTCQKIPFVKKALYRVVILCYNPLFWPEVLILMGLEHQKAVLRTAKFMVLVFPK